MSNIRKSKKHEKMPDFDEIMTEVEEDIQKKDAEDAVVNRAPELKKLSEDIDKAINTWINATLQLESAIQQYQRCERKLDSTVTDISVEKLIPSIRILIMFLKMHPQN